MQRQSTSTFVYKPIYTSVLPLTPTPLDGFPSPLQELTLTCFSSVQRTSLWTWFLTSCCWWLLSPREPAAVTLSHTYINFYISTLYHIYSSYNQTNFYIYTVLPFFYHTNNQPLQIHFIYFLGIHETFHTLTLQIRLNYVFKSYLINSMPISCLAEFFRHSVQVVHM